MFLQEIFVLLTNSLFSVNLFFTTNADTKTKGVAILFAKHFPFSLIKEIKNLEGHYLLVKGLIGELL